MTMKVYLILLNRNVYLELCEIEFRFTPYEWYNPYPCNKNPDHLENRFKLLNCLWFTIGSLMRQGCDILPK